MGKADAVERLLWQHFARADPRYGPVPLWWWSGETVTEERLRWQLQQLRAAGLRNLCIINLAPAGPAHGCAADDPPFYSERWWEMFGCALDEAERLGMFLWFYDQIGFSGANFPARLVTERPEFAGYRLRRFPASDPPPPAAEVIATAGAYTYATVRQGFDWLDPAAAGALLDRIHGEMERRCGDRLGRVLVGSFQDELQPMPTWTARVPAAYRARYGEDLIEHLPALFEHGPGAGALRRRFFSLLAELAETAFFRPLGEWHARHRMLLGCDQAGVGRQVDPHGAQRLYLDYFRTHRHFSVPGSDMDGEAKPHSSLVHLSGGRRVWLEGFHSSGWGGTIEETLHWLVPWLQAGVTLFDPHAIYYSTRGGWWEWAPPDTGWRQPYAEHYPIFADAVARACWLLTQGRHVCDIAVYYPGQAIWEHMSLADLQSGEHPQAVARRDPDEEVRRIREVYWALVGRQARGTATVGVLRADRRDFDLVGDAALAGGQVTDGELCIAAERYRALILPGVSVVDAAAQERLQAFVAGGGFLLAVGLPADAALPPGAVRVAAPSGAPGALPAALAGVVDRRADGPGLALQRRVGESDVFLLLPPLESLLPMHAASTAPPQLPAAATYRLLSTGRPELWDPVSGMGRPLSFTRDGDRLVVQVPFTDWPAAFVVCRPEKPPEADRLEGMPLSDTLRPAVAAWPGQRDGLTVRTFPMDDWRVHVLSTADNRFGDFDLHGSSEFLSVERRHFRVQTERGDQEGEAAGWHLPSFDDRHWSERLWSEATRWLVAKVDPFDRSQATPAVYSTTLGDMAFRDYAGRMGRVPRAFLSLGRAQRGETIWGFTHVLAPQEGRYWLQVEGAADKAALVNGEEVLAPDPQGAHAVQTRVVLHSGANELLVGCTAVRDGPQQLAVQITHDEPAPQPHWLRPQPAEGSDEWILRRAIVTEAAVRQVRLHFAAQGHVELWVNGHRAAVEGDFAPYSRSGQQEIDVTAFWQRGANEVDLRFPERGGYERAFLDGAVLEGDGTLGGFATGPEWTDAAGRPALLVPHAGSSEALWIRPRPHPLPDIGWLMPASVPSPAPLPMLLDPEEARRPVWLRFPLPVGARELHLAAHGAARTWVGGREVAFQEGTAAFEPAPAGTLCAVRVVPEGPRPEAAVLAAPIRFQTAPCLGSLGDWRTALHLPHHSGAVEYERIVEGKGPRAWLDLGYVRGTAAVWVDGQSAGLRLWHPFVFDLEGLWGVGRHRLRIRVTNTLGAHYELGRPTSHVGSPEGTERRFVDESNAYATQIKQLVGPGQGAGGLFGPVRLCETDTTT